MWRSWGRCCRSSGHHDTTCSGHVSAAAFSLLAQCFSSPCTWVSAPLSYRRKIWRVRHLRYSIRIVTIMGVGSDKTRKNSLLAGSLRTDCSYFAVGLATAAYSIDSHRKLYLCRVCACWHLRWWAEVSQLLLWHLRLSAAGVLFLRGRDSRPLSAIGLLQAWWGAPSPIRSALYAWCIHAFSKR